LPSVCAIRGTQREFMVHGEVVMASVG
jgi:hypothetical protein